MKKMIIALLAIVLLTACGKQEEPVAPIPEEPAAAETPVEEKPAEDPVEEKPAPVEIPVQIVEPEAEPEQPSGENCPIQWETTHLEGLIEDTVAYDLEMLTFSGVDGAEKMTRFYAELAAQLEKHTKENIYSVVMEQHTGANVYGRISNTNFSLDHFEATYEYRVEYLNGSEPESFTRTDRFDVHTGEVLAAEE